MFPKDPLRNDRRVGPLGFETIPETPVSVLGDSLEHKKPLKDNAHYLPAPYTPLHPHELNRFRRYECTHCAGLLILPPLAADVWRSELFPQESISPAKSFALRTRLEEKGSGPSPFAPTLFQSLSTPGEE